MLHGSAVLEKKYVFYQSKRVPEQPREHFAQYCRGAEKSSPVAPGRRFGAPMLHGSAIFSFQLAWPWARTHPGRAKSRLGRSRTAPGQILRKALRDGFETRLDMLFTTFFSDIALPCCTGAPCAKKTTVFTSPNWSPSSPGSTLENSRGAPMLHGSAVGPFQIGVALGQNAPGTSDIANGALQDRRFGAPMLHGSAIWRKRGSNYVASCADRTLILRHARFSPVFPGRVGPPDPDPRLLPPAPELRKTFVC